jgi:hypothetical protein
MEFAQRKSKNANFCKKVNPGNYKKSKFLQILVQKLLVVQAIFA